MANITKPAVERHSCDIAGCASMAENPMYWGVSFPIVAQDNYDDGSYFGGMRTRIINRSIDLCDYHARILLALHGEHTSNYGNAWTDDGPELQAHDARREQTEERQVMTEENDLPNLTTGEWWTLFRMAGHTQHPAFIYPQTPSTLAEKGLADKDTETLTAKGRELIEQVNRLTEQDWRNIPKVKIRRAAATCGPNGSLTTRMKRHETMRCISEGTDHEHRIRDRALLQPELPYPFQLDRLHTATTRMEAGTQTGHTGYHRP